MEDWCVPEIRMADAFRSGFPRPNIPTASNTCVISCTDDESMVLHTRDRTFVRYLAKCKFPHSFTTSYRSPGGLDKLFSPACSIYPLTNAFVFFTRWFRVTRVHIACRRARILRRGEGGSSMLFSRLSLCVFFFFSFFIFA